MAQAEGRKADHDFALGRIRAQVWVNHTEHGKVWFNSKFTRSYQDGGEWHEATTFGLDDLPIVALAASMAFSWCWRQKMPAKRHQRQAVDGNGQPESIGSSDQGGSRHVDDPSL